MTPNPFLGVFFHWLGGLAAASFYIPYRGVRKWSWETYWLVGGCFSWIIAPALIAWWLVPNLGAALSQGAGIVPEIPSHILEIRVLGPWLQDHPGTVMFWAYLFGAMWGLGGLTFGLTMRYLGIALGMAVALGYCTAFGTLIPPLFEGRFPELLATSSGHWILWGVAVCLSGIVVSGAAGMSKERELTAEQKQATIREFSFFKGILVATFSGIMSASFAYGLRVGSPIGDIALASLQEHGGQVLWKNLPVLVVVLWGGFTTNFIWCVLLNIKNRSGREYLAWRSTVVAEANATAGAAASSPRGTSAPPVRREPVPICWNYLLSAIAGITWYMQFFFYSMGETQMGDYAFSSWTLHMASIIIFSTLWGIVLREWRGTSRRTHVLIAVGLAMLIASTVVVGYGNKRGADEAKALDVAQVTPVLSET